MDKSDEIILCNLYYFTNETSLDTTQQYGILLIKNNEIFIESTYNCNPKTREFILRIHFEIDNEYIENLKTLLFGVLRRNKANKCIYKNYKPTPRYPMLWIGENIIDFVTPIKLYNELYILNKNMKHQIIKKDAEISALKQILEEKDELIKQTNSTFSLDKLVGYSLEDDDEFVEATWP
jgi:hypothetical protein